MSNPEGASFDIDRDNDNDLSDVTQFQRTFTGR